MDKSDYIEVSILLFKRKIRVYDNENLLRPYTMKGAVLCQR